MLLFSQLGFKSLNFPSEKMEQNAFELWSLEKIVGNTLDM